MFDFYSKFYIQRSISYLADDSFAEDFANGYLLGKILHKHGLQVNHVKYSNLSIILIH